MKNDQTKLGKEFVENVLVHHGVKGMRWGVRKDESSSSVVGRASFGEVSSMGHGIPSLTLTGNDLTVDRSKGYADIRPANFPPNAGVASRHAEIISALDEVRAAYPAVAKLNIEVVPMSRVPSQAHEVNGSFASVQCIKKGEARIMYNDKIDQLEPYQQAFVKQYMPGVSTKNYLGYHEMGHVLAIAHGTQPPSHEAMASGLSSKSARKYDKQNQKQHKALLKQNGLKFKNLRKLSPYAATMPSEATAELIGHTLSPIMRSRLDPATRSKADALINEMGGI